MTTREKRLERLRNFRIATEWPLVEKFYKSELESVLNHIADKNANPSIKTSLRKYLIISCVSLIDVFLSHLIQRSIDKYKIHISRIVGKTTEREANKLVSDYGKLIGKNITKGEYVGSHSGYTNSYEINAIFTEFLKTDKKFRRLNIDFFEAVKKVNLKLPLRYVKGSRLISHNWSEFITIFELRTEVVHDMKQVDLSDRRLKSYCDNTIIFLSAAIFIVDPRFRDDVIQLLQS